MTEITPPSFIPDGAKTSSPSGSITPLMPLKTEFTREELQTVPELNLKTYTYLVEDIARQVEKDTGIYYLVPIVQSAHESRNGNSGLCRKDGNLFGIVATDSWKRQGGPIGLWPTWEIINGKRVNTSREFRHYHSWLESFQDWAHIISTLSVYKPAFSLLKDRSTVREGMKEMGKIYATDPNYAKKLLEIYDAVNS